MKTIKIITAIVIIFIVIIFSSCETLLDVRPEDKVPASKNYQSDFDARSAALGIEGLLQTTLADKYILLNELRGDLLDVTNNADYDMRMLSQHKVDTTNIYTNTTDFYKVILSCNDLLKNIEIMKKNNKISAQYYRDIYSEIISVRAWVYLQLGIHYGNIIYITEPIEDIDMSNKTYPVISFDALIDSLVLAMEKVPNLAIYTIEGYTTTSRGFIDKECLLADLYLWQGNFYKAAVMYKNMMGESGNDLTSLDKYKCSYYFGYNYLDKSDNRFKWADMFKTYTGGTSTSSLLREWRWYWTILSQYDQTNSMIKWFSSKYGSYILKPSQLAINLWDSQFLKNGQQGDLRGEGASWAYENGNPVVQKYLFGVTSSFANDADIYIYRGGTLHLRFAEAVNRLRMCDLAYAFLSPATNIAAEPAAKKYSDYNFRFDTVIVDGVKKAYKTKEGYFKFGLDYGVRGRVFVAGKPLTGAASIEDSLFLVEQMISDEYALEMAYEGDRWSNLLRIARYKEKEIPGTGGVFLSETIARKFDANGDVSTASYIRSFLSKKENWFLPMRKK
jgi:hypothetical protein